MTSKNTLLPVQTLIQSRGRLLDLSRPVVMGILNATPDSFYNKGRQSSMAELMEAAGRMLEEGAVILDVGGASTRQGAALIDPELEAERVIPLLQQLHNNFPGAWLSVDTYHAATAARAIEAGTSIINDVSSGRFDPAMWTTVAAAGVPYIAMHMQGTPRTMQQNPQYEDVVFEVADSLRRVCDQCTKAGIKDILIDPGFGFGKTNQHNFELLRNLHVLRIAGRPLMVGLSRKSMVYRTLQVTPDQALNGTTALHLVALQQGARILRVHDVKEAIETIQLFEALYAHEAATL